MSRIGKLPIEIPQGVDVKVEEHQITVTGPNGTEVVPVRPEITIKLEDGHIVVTRVDDSRVARSLHGLSRTLIASTGTSYFFSREATSFFVESSLGFVVLTTRTCGLPLPRSSAITRSSLSM